MELTFCHLSKLCLTCVRIWKYPNTRWEFIVWQFRSRYNWSCGSLGAYKSSCHGCLVAFEHARLPANHYALLLNFSLVIQTVCLSEPTYNQPDRTNKRQTVWEGSQHLMNELTELDNAGSPEPGLRLRKGHMSDTATTQAAFEENSSEQRLLLVEPPLSSDQESVSYMVIC